MYIIGIFRVAYSLFCCVGWGMGTVGLLFCYVCWGTVVLLCWLGYGCFVMLVGVRLFCCVGWGTVGT